MLQATGLTRPSSGRAKAGFASFVPPLKSNVRPHKNPMKYYCTLILRAESSEAPRQVLESSVLAELERTDFRAPQRIAQAERWRTMGSVQRSDLPRYAWHLDSRRGVEDDEMDPYIHVSWLLGHLKRNEMGGSVQRKGVEASLTFYWSGGGTGGGPFISPILAALLAEHNIGLEIGFYYIEELNAA